MGIISHFVTTTISHVNISEEFLKDINPQDVCDVVKGLFGDGNSNFGRYCVAAEYVRMSCKKYPEHQDQIIKDCESFLQTIYQDTIFLKIRLMGFKETVFYYLNL